MGHCLCRIHTHTHTHTHTTSASAAYPECKVHADCLADQFCGTACRTGGCGAHGSVVEDSPGRYCQPCSECTSDSKNQILGPGKCTPVCPIGASPPPQPCATCGACCCVFVSAAPIQILSGVRMFPNPPPTPLQSLVLQGGGIVTTAQASAMHASHSDPRISLLRRLCMILSVTTCTSAGGICFTGINPMASPRGGNCSQIGDCLAIAPSRTITRCKETCTNGHCDPGMQLRCLLLG